MRRVLALVSLAVVLAGVGCLAPADVPGDIGTENGYRYDADLDVTTADGLNDSEREAVLGRMMARIEHIRGLEFTETTSIEVISRTEFQNRSGGFDGNLTTRQRWNEQVWEALHIIGESETLPGTQTTNRGSSVVGYYSPSDEQIVLVSDSSTPTVDRRTLVHELVHALQDQRLNLGERERKQDRQLAVRSVVEGDANYVQALYGQRCAEEWDCLSIPQSNRTRPAGFNQGLFLVSFLPYAEGPQFVDAMRARGGWQRVNARYDEVPESSEQIIHPERFPTDPPRSVSVPDRSTQEWRRFSNLSNPRTDTVGEGSIYAMFVATDVIDRSGSSVYDYDHQLSAGWDGDTLVPYRSEAGAYGYVWKISWSTRGDARKFVEGYRKVLNGYDTGTLGDGRYVVRTGDFADAFRVSRTGTTVTIVNAPTVGQLAAIHPEP